MMKIGFIRQILKKLSVGTISLKSYPCLRKKHRSRMKQALQIRKTLQIRNKYRLENRLKKGSGSSPFLCKINKQCNDYNTNDNRYCHYFLFASLVSTFILIVSLVFIEHNTYPFLSIYYL